MSKSKIEWTEHVWNPVSGCTKISPGCKHCYAEVMANRLRAMGAKGYENGFALTLQPDRLDIPLRRKKPTTYFVNSMSDLFHEGVPDSYIDQVFAVMALSPQHTFQVLTKRPERMLAYMTKRMTMPNIDQLAFEIARDQLGGTRTGREWEGIKWPLSNVHLGVTVENQEAADERIPLLLQTPAAVRWASVEPMLEAIDLSRIKAPNGFHASAFGGQRDGNYYEFDNGLNWVVCGGESGKNKRPMNLDWARSLRDQCAAAGVPFLFKQIDGTKAAGRLLDGVLHDEYPA